MRSASGGKRVGAGATGRAGSAGAGPRVVAEVVGRGLEAASYEKQREV